MATENTITSVTLPCGQDEFGEFIKSLLGKPQSITNQFRGAFDLSRHDLAQFHYLILDRMNQQNKVQLAMFTARVLYEDGSSIQVNDFEAFNTYNEIRPLVSEAVHLSWEFLVTFVDRKAPEKQQVEISFLTGTPFHVMDRIGGEIIFGSPDESHGIITYRINHTARTWASDIDAMLSAHIKNILPTVPKWRELIETYSDKIGLATFLLLLLSSVVTLLKVGSSFWLNSRDALSKSIVAQPEIGQKINLIAQYVSSGAGDIFKTKAVVFFVLAIIVSVSLGIWASITSKAKRPAFLCLTRKSEEAKLKAIKKSQHRFLWFLVSVLVSIACGVIGNYLFALYVRASQTISQ